MGAQTVVIPPGEAAELLARYAAPVTDPGRAETAIEAVRGLCQAAAAGQAGVSPDAILDRLDGVETLVISGAEVSGRRSAWPLEEAVALALEPQAECGWSPHPQYPSHCLLVAARRSGRTVFFDVPGPAEASGARQ
jgi:hypothetical protein